MSKETKKILADYSSRIRQIGQDSRMLASHVSLFTALFSCYQQNGFQSPFPITRKTVMGFSKIASIATYHKCMKDLDAYGYISYHPSFHAVKGSLIYWPEKDDTGRQNTRMINLSEQSASR